MLKSLLLIKKYILNTERSMSDNLIYWISVLLGFMIVLITYKYSSRFLENFAVSPSSTSVTVNTSDESTLDSAAQNGPVVPTPIRPTPARAPVRQINPSAARPALAPAPKLDVNSMPKSKNLLLYFNSFNIESNQYISANNRNTTYIPTMNKWSDALKPNQYSYSFYGAVPPTTIGNIGLPMKNIKIAGPAAGELSSNNYILDSFSVVFYLTFNSLAFDMTNNNNNNDIVLFEIFAASPNYIKLSIAPIHNDAKNISVDIIIGTLIHSWIIPITTILSNGASTLYSIVYNKNSAENQFVFYIGLNTNTVAYTATYGEKEQKPTLNLTYEPLLINENQNLDAYLSAFCFYNSPLTADEMSSLGNYFASQLSGAYLLEASLLALEASLLSQNNALLNQLNSSSQLISQLKNQPKSCPAAQVVAPTPSGPKWHIKMDNVSSVNDIDLQQCSPLTLKEFDITLPTLPIPNITKTAKIIKNNLNTRNNKPFQQYVPAPASASTQSQIPFQQYVPAPASAPTQSQIPFQQYAPAPAPTQSQIPFQQYVPFSYGDSNLSPAPAPTQSQIPFQQYAPAPAPTQSQIPFQQYAPDPASSSYGDSNLSPAPASSSYGDSNLSPNPASNSATALS